MRLLILCILFTLPALAQYQGKATIANTYRYFEVKDGLPQMQVWSLTEDSHGFIWVCTKDGLARWDGKNFRTWNSRTPGFGPAHARELIQVGPDEYMALTGNTVRWIKGSRISKVNLPDSIIQINDIYKLNDSEVILAGCRFNSRPYQYVAINNVIYNFRTGATKKTIITKGDIKGVFDEMYFFTCYEKTSLNNDPAIIYLYSTSEGAIDSLTDLPHWPVFTTNADFYHNSLLIKGKKYTAGTQTQNIYRLSVHNKRLYQYEIKTNKPVLIDNNSSWLQFIYINDTTYCYIDPGHYVHLVKGNTDEVYCKVSSAVTAATDHNNNVWIGSEQGLYCFYSNSFRKYDFNFSTGEGSDNIWSITQDISGLYYIADYNRGIYEYNDKTHTWRKAPLTLGSKTLDNVSRHRLNTGTLAATRLWNGGVLLPMIQGFGTKDKKAIHMYMPLLADAETYGAVTDTLHRCTYIAQYYHLYRINTDHSLDTICSAEAVGLNNIMSCTIDRRGRLFIGGSGIKNSIIKYENGICTPVARKCRTPISMCADSRDNVWIAANDSFYIFGSGGLHPVNIPSSSLFNSVKAYNEKWMIIGTNKEIILLDMDAYYKNGSIVCYQYDYTNGFNTIDCSQNSMLIDNDGTVWVPTMKTMIRFNPLALTKERDTATPVIEDIYFSGKDFRWQTDTSVYAASVELKPRWRNLQFSFVAANIDGASRITYRYRLNGYNQEWSSSTTNNIAIFNDLPPGIYRFEVCCSLDGITWGAPTVSRSVVLQAAFYETFFFRIAASLFMLLLMAWMVVALTRRKYRKKLTAQQQNMQILSLKFQAIRSKAIPHFSSNVFNNIDYLIENKQYDDATRYLALLSRLYNYILRDAENASRSLTAELEFVTNYLLLEKMRFNDSLKHEIHISTGINMDMQIPNMVLHTYVENAIKHGIMSKRGYGKVTIRVTQAPGGILLQVEDDGIGRAAAKQYNKHSTRQGLSILSQQIELYNNANKNKIVQHIIDRPATNETASGTIFQIYIPEQYNFHK